MGPLLAIILPLLAKLPGMVGDYFKQTADLQLEKLKTDAHIEQEKQRLAGEIAKAQLELSKTVVNATGTKFKYFTFIMWFGPFMIGTISPSRANEIFTNWAGMPSWYVQSCMIIMFAVWGISVSAPVVSNIFSGLGQFIASRKDAKREFEIQKAKVNRDAMFTALKTKWFPKGMNQQQVNDFDEVIDEGEK